MAAVTTRTCDRRLSKTKVCGEIAPAPYKVNFGGHWLSVDLCPEHREEEEGKYLQQFMDRTGATFSTVPRAANPKRKVYYDEKNGVYFTADDVRRWMAEQGTDSPTTGRLSEAMISAFENRKIAS